MANASLCSWLPCRAIQALLGLLSLSGAGHRFAGGGGLAHAGKAHQNVTLFEIFNTLLTTTSHICNMCDVLDYSDIFFSVFTLQVFSDFCGSTTYFHARQREIERRPSRRSRSSIHPSIHCLSRQGKAPTHSLYKARPVSTVSM